MPRKKYETEEAKKKARQDYYTSWRKKNQKSVTILLNVNKESDMELYSWLQGKPNKSAYVKSLIRRDIYEI